MKAAQMFSIIPMPTESSPANQAAFQTAMARLLQEAPPMAPELAAEVVRAELGAHPEEIFAEFSPEPIASASIGQVHLARHHDGRPLAVKVQYPGVAEAIKSDLRNTELLAVTFQLFRSMMPGLARSDPRTIAAEVSARIIEELDYRLEAANQTFFAQTYAGHPFIRIPSVLPELSTSRVLTQDFVEGLPWGVAIEASQELRDQWGEAIFRFGHGSLRKLGVFNADPHPGNYLFHEDGTVTFIDFGCVKRFTPAEVDQIHAIYRAAMEHDGDLLWHTLVESGTFDAKHAPTPDELMTHFRTRFEVFIGKGTIKMTPEMLSKILDQEFALGGVDGRFLRSIKNSEAWMFYSRLELGIYGILAGLQGSADGSDIIREFDLGEPPVTPLGLLEADFWAARTHTQ
jgi:predicted unusual protein kinase regulating ubiquinone biosynthesis (AarF/ABC1/UbiB family)